MIREVLRSGAAYAIAIALLTFYGGRVCPLIDSLGLARLAGILAGCFAAGAALKLAALAWLKPHDRRAPGTGPWGFFFADLAIWLVVAMVFAAFDWFVWKFPFWTSGMKMAVGTAALGFYAASFDALRRERELIERAASGEIERFVAGPPLNTAQRFFWFTAASLFLIAGVLVLLLYKDLVMEKIPVSGGHAPPGWFQAIFLEILFVLGILLAGTTAVTVQYAGNLRRMFDLEQQALDAVKAGRFDVSVPVVSRDEFSEIADGTNGMIEGLREKETFRSILGMVVSPTVAKRILERRGMLGGEIVEATVFFSDVRDYTTLSETVTPQQLVSMLNEYFTLSHRVIERHGGFVNKFIGDAVMAVFGLDRPDGSCEAALKAAVEIRSELVALNARFREQGLPAIEIGIGIHHGDVVAGVIGAKERVEFTVIGDTVNTAARLESLTKDVQSSVAVSDAVHTRVASATQSLLRPLGEHPLKGKSAKVAVFGLADAARASQA